MQGAIHGPDEYKKFHRPLEEKVANDCSFIK